MCLAIPGRVIEIKDNRATIDYGAEKRTGNTDLVKPKIGDYVYVQGGFVIEILEKTFAEKTLSIWINKLNNLNKIDERLSQIKRIKNIDENFKKIVNKSLTGMPISKIEAIFLLNSFKKENLAYLFSVANFLRHKNLGNSCCVHGIIEFSNYCKNNCKYCGIRADNKKIKRYRMSEDEIIDTVVDAVKRMQFKTLVLQSGEDDYYTKAKLVKIVKGILKKCNVLLFLSIGKRDKETYKALYKAGVRGMLFRFETSNEKLFNNLHPGQNYKNRINTLETMNNQGFLIATGFLLGLQNQDQQNILDDILLTKDYNPEMYSFGPFIPHNNTPLAKEKKPKLINILKIIAITRLLDPKARILVTTAMETLNKTARKRALISGANSLMINITPKTYREDYLLYPDKFGTKTKIPILIKETMDLMYSIGRLPTELGEKDGI